MLRRSTAAEAAAPAAAESNTIASWLTGFVRE
jgi:hypothetical protein